MKVKFKPFRIYVEKYHVEGGNIYPPRILNLQRVGLLLAIIIGIVVALSSCSNKYIVEKSANNNCGVWYPKKFRAK